MAELEKVIKGLECCLKESDHLYSNPCNGCPYEGKECIDRMKADAIALLKEQEKKEIKLHKKHVLTLKRNDEFTMRKLYESICEKLLDEGEMIITRTDDHEKVEFVFYVAGE